MSKCTQEIEGTYGQRCESTTLYTGASRRRGLYCDSDNRLLCTDTARGSFCCLEGCRKTPYCPFGTERDVCGCDVCINLPFYIGEVIIKYYLW